jgi:hypothetical protein
MLKFPEIRPVVNDMFPQYSLSYFLDNTSRYSTTVEVGDRIVKWALKGRRSRPSTILSTFTGSATAFLGNTSAVVDFQPGEMYLHPNDVVRFPNGTNAWVYGIAGNQVTFKLQSNSNTESVDLSAAGGQQLGVIGNMFPEGSQRGYGNQAFPDWYMNALGIYRKQLDITGDAITDILWVEFNGQKLWFFEQEQEFYRENEYEQEVDRWLAHTTVDVNGNPMQFDAQGKPVFKGDGLLRQVDANNIDTYNGVLTTARITNFIAYLQFNTGIKGATYMVWGGKAAQLAWNEAMQNFFVQPGALVWNASTGGETELGSTYSTYHVLGSKVVFAHNPIFDDTNIFTEMVTNSFGTYPKMSYTMFFANISQYGEMSNLELAVKSAGGINRHKIIKYIPGMINPMDKSTMLAATGDDKFSVEYLSHTALVLHNPYSCGTLYHA